ncbi:hypothetical protein [Nocardioides sp. LHG3406-4]|uniref:hypothetical protein n=1 Tax=Nocardioides sp. LHG3406-4 TaxID=2804575 RepID=UPI003CEF051B
MLTRYLSAFGLPSPAQPHVAAAPQRFPDGGAFRVEIPSVEGPEALMAVFKAAHDLDVPVHRVSQGSGVMMLSDTEITAMVDQCAEERVELCLFLGPRGTWDIGAGTQSPSGGGGIRARGSRQLWHSIDDAQRAVELGVTCLLVGDEGTLWALHQLREAGHLPSHLTLKVSALAGPSNPAAFRVLEGLGADSVNIVGDLTIEQMAEIRAAGTAALDVYVESPDDVGGFVRHHDAPDIVRHVAPVYLKFGVRNAPPIYPAGEHLMPLVLGLARERVRRARLCLDLLEREGLAESMSPQGNTALPAVRRLALAGTTDATPEAPGSDRLGASAPEDTPPTNTLERA